MFGRYFPVAFKNWWSDDWISNVYGREHTLRWELLRGCAQGGYALWAYPGTYPGVPGYLPGQEYIVEFGPKGTIHTVRRHGSFEKW